MAGWNEILEEHQRASAFHDVIRRKYLKKLSELTGRNTILYYSGWLQKPEMLQTNAMMFQINDDDKNGFMATVHQLDRSKGLDLILHTPGGDLAATESLVAYLRSMFGNDIRALVPQLALSAGTMMALSASEIVLGKQSSLGPIDPQLNNLPAHGVVEEFNKARSEILANAQSALYWQPILQKYNATFVGECQKAIDWSRQMVTRWLETGMFQGDADQANKIARVLDDFGDHALTLSHSRHIDSEAARASGLKIVDLESDPDLQDAVLTVHHATIQTLAATGAMKVIENQNGAAYIRVVSPISLISQNLNVGQQPGPAHP